MTRHGRLTLPAEVGAERETLDLIRRLGADATRNSDGTDLPEGVADMVEKVYRTWFVARGDNDHARAHLDELQQVYLLSERATATGDGPLVIDPMVGFLAEQVRPAVEHDPKRWWEVRDRTTDAVLGADEWEVDDAGVVTLAAPTPWHEYTVAFLAQQIWDPTQMYNYITNDWDDREKSMPYDARYPATWEFMKRSLGGWLAEHPEIDVVRFTTFFYHFTLVFNEHRKEKFVDWFGYSESVSVAALEAFEEETGITVNVVAVGTGQAIQNARNCDADVLLVHAKHERARAWYQRYGFEPSPTDPLHLVLLLKDLKRVLASDLA